VFLLSSRYARHMIKAISDMRLSKYPCPSSPVAIPKASRVSTPMQLLRTAFAAFVATMSVGLLYAILASCPHATAQTHIEPHGTNDRPVYTRSDAGTRAGHRVAFDRGTCRETEPLKAKLHVSTYHPMLGQRLAVSASRSIIPRDCLKAIWISWGDGSTPAHLARLSAVAHHKYAAPGRWVIRLTLHANHGTIATDEVQVSVRWPAALGDVSKHLTNEIGLIDVNEHDTPFPVGGDSDNVMSADGEHIIWNYNVRDAGREYGSIIRNLRTGETIIQPAVWRYALGLSAEGRYIAYATSSAVARTGEVVSTTAWLWDTKTDQKLAISRTPIGQVATDGIIDGLQMSANGQWVVFESTSQQMAPAGLTMCPRCGDGASYIYLYDRATGKITSVPPQATYGSEPQLRDPVISANGEVIAFERDGHAEVWYPRENVVRPVEYIDEPFGWTNAQSLAISADGSTLANLTVEGITAVKLGGQSGSDTLEWDTPKSEPTPPEGGVALSANGGVMAYTAPTVAGVASALWRVTLPSGTPELLSSPPLFGPKSTLTPSTGVVVLGRVSITANGEKVVAAGCPFVDTLPSDDKCLREMHLYEWNH
jgi:hypothetical protein